MDTQGQATEGDLRTGAGEAGKDIEAERGNTDAGNPDGAGSVHRNIYVDSQAAPERTLASVQSWIEKHLRLQVNAAKSGTGRAWERKFLGFRLDRKKRIGIAPESLERFNPHISHTFCCGAR